MPGSFLPIILAWSGLHQKHCLFVLALCMSNFPRSEHISKSGIRFRCMSHWSTVRQNRFIEPVASLVATFDFSIFSTLGLPEGESVQGQTMHHRCFERQHLSGDHQHWEWCSMANGGQHAVSCSDMSSGGRQLFLTLDVKSSSSAWIYVWVTLILFCSMHVLHSYRPQWPRCSIWITLHCKTSSAKQLISIDFLRRLPRGFIVY